MKAVLGEEVYQFGGKAGIDQQQIQVLEEASGRGGLVGLPQHQLHEFVFAEGGEELFRINVGFNVDGDIIPEVGLRICWAIA